MYGSSCRTFMKLRGQHIEPHLVIRLNYIMEQVQDLKIVMSSSWRSDMDDLQNQLELAGFKYWNKVIGKIPKSYREHEDYTIHADIILKHRGEQIRQYLLDNKFTGKYLVVDDEVSDICSPGHNYIPKENVISIDMNDGMLHYDAMDIIEYFKVQELQDTV